MIEKMSYINIMGSINDIDRVINTYISHYDIQLEYTERELSETAKLSPCMGENPYGAYLDKARNLAEISGLDIKPGPFKEMDSDDAVKLIQDADQFFEQKDVRLKALESKRDMIEDTIAKIEPFILLDFDVSSLKAFEFIRFRFGKMPIANFKQLESYVYDHSEILFLESKRERGYVYGVYFVPYPLKDRVDTLFSSLNFQRILLPFTFDNMEFSGTPMEAHTKLLQKLDDVNEQIGALQAETLFALGINKQDTIDAYYRIKTLYANYELRKYAARTEDDFYIFVGWMTVQDAKSLNKAVTNDKKVVLIVEADDAAVKSRIPTKLKNNPVFRPFEFFVRTYGLPQYSEMDPTPFVAVTYILLFGLMFGDLGQGAVISLLGIYMYKTRKLDLGAVMAVIGISSMVFGVLYGSVFGMEEIIPALWIRPSEHITQMLLMSVGLGAVLIIIAMLLNMKNAFKNRDKARLLLSPSGVSGLVFYLAVIMIALSMFTGYFRIATGLIAIFIFVPLVIIAFREPLAKFLKKERNIVEGSIPMFLLETVIELFEVLLTYFTNTVSFVRVGAFALSHAGMMSVVLLLAESASGSYNPAVLVLGNLLVMGMEGLVVGIQVLRIEFYELFSRYYEGGGRKFEPVGENGSRVGAGN